MTTRKELLGRLMSKGIVVTNPLFENEELKTIDTLVEDILDSYCDMDCDGTEDCDCPECCEEALDEIEEEVEVKDIELIGKIEGDTEVIHVLYPGAGHYPLIMDWANRIKDEYEGVDLKYFDDQDVFVFFSGDEDEALNIAEKIIDEIENEE